MPKLNIQNRNNIEIETNPAISLLQLLGRNGIDVMTKCGGRARCGFCRVTVVSGMDNFNSPNERELVFRKKHDVPANIRLACQSFVRGDAVIMIGQHKLPQET